MTLATIGQMRERITLQTRTGGVSGPGDVAYTWTNWITLWARVTPMRVDVTNVADRLEALGFFEVTCRYVAGVSNTNRITWRGRNLQVRGIKNADEHKRFLTIDCQDMSADGGV